jgi:hypothetical protein
MKYRKTNRVKKVDSGCKNHGSCKICRNNRLYSSRKRLQDKIETLKDES